MPSKIKHLKSSTYFLQFVLSFISCNSFAERLMPIDFTGQVQMSVKDLNTHGCGIRFVGVQTPMDLNNKAERIWLVDASFMIYENGMGLVKALIAETKISEINKKKNNYQVFNTFWLKADNHPITSPIKGRAVDGETKGSKIYATDIDSIINLYLAVLSGEQLKLAYKFKDQSKDVIFYGKVSLKDDEINQITVCMSELSSLVIKD